MNGYDPFGRYCVNAAGDRIPCRVSDQGLDFIARHEGFSPTVYGPPNDVPTIGYGHALLPGETFESITPEEARRLLEQDAARTLSVIDAIEVELCQAQVDALVSFVFNVGVNAFQESNLRRRLNQGEYDAVPEELNRWVFSRGRQLPGLVRRRAEEGRLFETGNYGGGN